MVKIGSVEEFNRIKESEYGFILITKNGQNVLHKPQCAKLSADDFIDSNNPESMISFNWFSTVSLVEKEFPVIKSCEICNPD